jgi:hypothetical protein
MKIALEQTPSTAPIHADSPVNEFQTISVSTGSDSNYLIWHVDKGDIVEMHTSREFETIVTGNRLRLFCTAIDLDGRLARIAQKDVSVNYLSLGTPTGIERYDFEDGQIPVTFDNYRGRINSEITHSGQYSFGRFDGTSHNFTINPAILANNDKELHKITFWFFEGKAQAGFSMVALDQSGYEIMRVGSNNPQWETGSSGKLYNGLYRLWTKVEITRFQGDYYVVFQNVNKSVMTDMVYGRSYERIRSVRFERGFGDNSQTLFDDIELITYD